MPATLIIPSANGRPAAGGVITPDPDSITITMGSARTAIRDLIRARRNVMLWGSYGIGKSEAIHQIGVLLGMPVFEIRAATIAAVDLRGLPEVIEHVTKWARSGMLPSPDGAPSIIFLDEVNRASTQMVISALFQIMDQGRIGDHTFPEGTVVIGACNPNDLGTIKLGAAFRSRFFHLDVTSDFGEWVEWAEAKGSGIDPLVLAFLKQEPDLLDKPDGEARVAPNPRAWKYLSDYVSVRPDVSLVMPVAAGIVGKEAAIKFSAFYHLFAQLGGKVDRILADPAGESVPDEDEVGLLYALAASLAKRATLANFRAVMTYLARLPSQEYAVFSVRAALRRDEDLATVPGYGDWARERGA